MDAEEDQADDDRGGRQDCADDRVTPTARRTTLHLP
jgi:hypothetical protein